MESLEELPRLHAKVRDGLLAAGYRWSAVKPYMALSAIDEDAGTVNMERVLHGSVNWRSIVSRPVDNCPPDAG